MNLSKLYLSIVIAIALAACSSGGGNPAPVGERPGPITSILMSVDSLNLRLGDTAVLTATPRDASGRTVDGASIAWSVDKPAVATVTGAGQVEAIGVGTTPIKARAGNVEASIQLTVEPSDTRIVATVDIYPATGVVAEGQSIQFSAIARDANGHIIGGRGERWASGDSTIASVEPLGRTTGLRAGLTTVAVQIDGITASAAIRVDADYAFSLLYSAIGSPNNSLNAPELFLLEINDPAATASPVFAPARSANNPTPSPDGSEIAFVVASGADTHIYRAGRDGSNPVKLTSGAGLRDQPAWSSDGATIAYRERVTGQGTDIWTMSAIDGSGAVNLTADLGLTNQSSPAWSKSTIEGSHRIAFSHSESGQGHIWTMRADGGDKVQLTSSTTAYDDQPTWSPDGSRIVFQRSSPSIFGDLYWVDATAGGDGAALMPAIGPLAGPQFSPTWSPDGRLVAFTSRHVGDQYQIFTVWADGSRLAQRTFAGEHANPAWIID